MTQNSPDLKKSVNVTANILDGARVKSAQSSLESFAVIFEDGRGLLVNATVDEDECGIEALVVEAASIATTPDAVCSVDWSWIYGQSVVTGGVKQSTSISGASVKITLTSVGTITIASGMWQGKPFLSFMPYKKP